MLVVAGDAVPVWITCRTCVQACGSTRLDSAGGGSGSATPAADNHAHAIRRMNTGCQNIDVRASRKRFCIARNGKFESAVFRWFSFIDYCSRFIGLWINIICRQWPDQRRRFQMNTDSLHRFHDGQHVSDRNDLNRGG
jgi:hypothetical protein